MSIAKKSNNKILTDFYLVGKKFVFFFILLSFIYFLERVLMKSVLLCQGPVSVRPKLKTLLVETLKVRKWSFRGKCAHVHCTDKFVSFLYLFKLFK